MAKTIAEREAERREMLRASRVRNYRVKLAAGFACSVCGAKDQVLVAVSSSGEGDEEDAFATFCRGCIGDREPTPGQFDETLKGGDDAA